MSSLDIRIFIKRILFSLFGIIFIIVSVNYYFNDYGLFTDSNEKRIYINERESKYLLSLNYVPSNFDSILVGPSLSDHINTKKINDFKLYNLSISGGNISDLHPLIENVINKRNLKFVLFCLDPYLTKDYGVKSTLKINEPILTTLFSLKVLEINFKKIYYMLFPSKDIFVDSEWGYIKIKSNKQNNVLQKLDERIRQIQKGEYSIKVDKKALKELKLVTAKLKTKNIKILYYFHPIHYSVYNQMIYKDEYKKYMDETIDAIGMRSTILNMNDDKYDDFRKDSTNYLDSGHLSEKGTLLLINILNEYIKYNTENIK